MSSKVEILNPLEYPGWDDLLLTHEDYSFFHSSAWARVLHESYNYKPLYFTGVENGNLTALIPVMEVKSILTGRRGVSLPFTDFCQIIVSDEAQFKETIRQIIEYGEKAGIPPGEVAGLLSNAGICYQNMQESNQARDYFRQAVVAYDESGQPAEKSRLENILGQPG